MENTVPVHLEAVDLIGDECQLYLRCGTTALTAMFPVKNRPSPGQELRVALDLGRAHLFDAQSQAALAS